MLSKPDLFNAPSPAGTSLSRNDYVQPSLSHGLRIWWAYYWPTSLISIILVIFLLVLVHRAWERVLISGHVVLWANRVLPYLVFYGVSFVFIRYVLGRSFRSFRVALLPHDASASSEPLPRSFGRTLRVWWAFSWRAVVYSLIFRFAGNVALGYTIAFLASVGPAMGKLVPMVFQVAIDAAVGLFVMYSAILDEEFGDFRVSLLPREAVGAAAPGV